ncbi:unnamed protein product [Schistosoma curassoni]|uniref:IRS-type PTB domain-containing protein n=1 Tax=Schistosoma curassoni TaxID=6186 RepID=A0A183K9D1_9TREM|nr:unnamed protein product [Schistosoma curassoni]CAH8819698.1 unnamed protein product [Schistosoma curassoni]VDP45339.1 unnamed protein product [Schistosoma curassoni]
MVLRKKKTTPTPATSPASATKSPTSIDTTPTLVDMNQSQIKYSSFKVFIEYCVEIDANQTFTSQHLDAPVSVKHGIVKFVNIDRSLLLMLTTKEMFLDKPLWWPGTSELCINYEQLHDIIESRSDERKFALDIKSSNPGKRLIHVFSAVNRKERNELLAAISKNAQQYQQIMTQQRAIQQQQATYYLSQASAQKSSTSYVDQTLNSKEVNVTPVVTTPQKKRLSGRFSRKTAIKSPLKPLSFEDFPHSANSSSPRVFNFNDADCEAFGYSPTIYPASHQNDSSNMKFRNRSLSPTPLQCTTPEVYRSKPNFASRYSGHEDKGSQFDGPLSYTRPLSKSQPQLAYSYDNRYYQRDEYTPRYESQNNYRSPGYASHSPIVPKYANSASAGTPHTPNRIVHYNDDDENGYAYDGANSKSFKVDGDDLVLKINCYNPENRSKSPRTTHLVRISHEDNRENNNRKY